MEERLPAACHGNVQHRALFYGIIPLRDLPQQLDLTRFQLRDEAHRADIHAQNGNGMLRRDLGRVQNRTVAAKADEHVRRFDLPLDIPEAEVGRDLEILVHIERKAQRNLCARFPQDAAGLSGILELFVPIRVRRNDDLHTAVNLSMLRVPARQALRYRADRRLPAAWPGAPKIRYSPPAP